MRSLLIEDNSTLATCIHKALAKAHIVCDVVDMGEEGIELARLYHYDVILLDLGLPDIYGLEVLRRIRHGRVRTPVIITSAAADTERKIEALKLGAADYLSKPFDLRELVARMQAIVRRIKGHSASLIQTGRLTVDLAARTARVDGRPLPLPPKEYAILELLSLYKGRTLDKATFLDHLYGGINEPDLKIIDVFICKLRKKLHAATGGEEYLHTEWGYGHSLRDLPPAAAGEGLSATA